MNFIHLADFNASDNGRKGSEEKMDEVHDRNKKFRQEDGTDFRWANTDEILRYLGFPDGRDYPEARREVGSTFFRSYLCPDPDKDFFLPNVLANALNPEPGKKSPFEPEDVINDSIEYIRIQNRNDVMLLMQLVSILDDESLGWEEKKPILKNILNIFFQARIPRYQHLLESIGVYMKKVMNESESKGIMFAQEELRRKQQRIEELEEENKKLMEKLDDIGLSTWDIAVRAGILEAVDETDQYRSVSKDIGLGRILESWNSVIKEYAKSHPSSRIEFPSAGEIHEKLISIKTGNPLYFRYHKKGKVFARNSMKVTSCYPFVTIM